VRLLVVDAEPRVADALERVLLDLEPSWELLSARSNSEALAALAERPCDVILTELRADGLEGPALLGQVAYLHPHTARFVLSGCHDQDAPLDLLRVAHQLLPKPCAAETLHQVLLRLDALTRLLSHQTLQTLANRASLLPSSSERPGADRRAFRTDPAMAAKLLQLASSGFVCGSSKVADIDSALQQLGAHWTERLILALTEPHEVGPGDAVHSRQRRSVRIARLASRLARLPEDAAAAYLAGLLCDVGQLLLERADPQRVAFTCAEAARRNVPEHAVELSSWGVTHAELGAYLLGLWGLPFQIVEAVAHHHAPARAAADCTGLTQLVWLSACVVEDETPSADQLARLGAEELYALAQEAWRALRLEEERDVA
jgi:HD-like signal output (HDOD) protein/DNA-binding NarL/FixJ family response regulator